MKAKRPSATAAIASHVQRVGMHSAHARPEFMKLVVPMTIAARWPALVDREASARFELVPETPPEIYRERAGTPGKSA